MTLTSNNAEGLTKGAQALPAPRLIGGIPVTGLRQDEALAHLHAAMGEGRHVKLAFCNAHMVNLAARDRALRAALDAFLILPDGIGVEIGARLLHGAPFPANLNGTDFIPRLIATSPAPLHIALVGARAGVAEKAAAALRRLDGRHQITVMSDGFFDQAGEERLRLALEHNPAHLLLVALGNPKQEMWIAARIGPEHARVAAGVGALFDFLAGEVPRAPALLRQMRLEWLYRLAQEPGRLWRRYVLGNPAFLARMLRQKWRGRP
jgi:exopolysaccharide biosynthesis WecB/TagA/CpsF family protein